MLHVDFRLEINSRIETQIFMIRSRIAVTATMFAAAVAVQAVAKRDIGGIVFADDALRRIGQKLRFVLPKFFEIIFVIHPAW